MSEDYIINNSFGKIGLEYNINNNIRSSNINGDSSINENNNIIEFKEPNRKIDWKHYEQVVAHLKPDIERVWYFVQKFDILLLVHNQGHYPLILTKGNDTKKVGNQFQGNLYGKFPFVAKVNKNIEYPEFKKIEWLFFVRNKYYLSFKIELMKVTEDNSTSLLEKIKYEKNELFTETNRFFIRTKGEMFGTIEKILENEPINLVIYESGLINGQMEDIWDIATDLSKLSTIAPNNVFPSNINLRKLIKGQKETFLFKYKNNIDEYTAELVCKEEKPGWNKWLLMCDISRKNSKETSLLVQLTKINDNLCQLTYINKLFKAIKSTEFREVSAKIKYTIISIKDYFDNFFSPNNA